jgi:hypothetical protein
MHIVCPFVIDTRPITNGIFRFRLVDIALDCKCSLQLPVVLPKDTNEEWPSVSAIQPESRLALAKLMKLGLPSGSPWQSD